MTLPVLIDVQELSALIEAGAAPRLLDVRWALGDSNGEQHFRDGHIPGAVFVNLDEELASPPSPGKGRHPLPSLEDLQAAARRWGIDDGDSVVLYDATGNTASARGWWLLRWAGLSDVRLLDGGLQAWEAAGGAVTDREEPSHFQSNFAPAPALRTLATTKTVANGLAGQGQTIIDARAAPRFKGEVEPLDPVAGHIPGALNRPFAQNIGADGRFKPAAQLRAEFERLLAGRDPATVVHHCGSGVSAVPNVIAMEVAGLGPTALYAGSWSEWCADPSRPVEKG